MAYPRFQNIKEHANIFLESFVAPHSFEDKVHSSTQHSPLWSGPIPLFCLLQWGPTSYSTDAHRPSVTLLQSHPSPRNHTPPTLPAPPSTPRKPLPTIQIVAPLLCTPWTVAHSVCGYLQQHLLNTFPYSLQLMRCLVGFQKKRRGPVAPLKQQDPAWKNPGVRITVSGLPVLSTILDRRWDGRTYCALINAQRSLTRKTVSSEKRG